MSAPENKDLSPTVNNEEPSREEKDRRLRKAALAAKDLYAPGSEFIEWTCLDGEDFLEDYV